MRASLCLVLDLWYTCDIQKKRKEADPVIEKIRQLPYPGLRILKTALAATCCIIVYTLIGRLDGLPLACIAIFICIQDSVDKSWKVGKDRGLGTLLGGVLASIVGLISVAEQHLAVVAAVAFAGIVLYIFACTLLKIEGSIVIGLATYIIVVFGPQAGEVAPVALAVARTLDTLIGIVVGCTVNILFFRPRPERFRGHDTINPVFHYEVIEESHQKTIKWDGGETKELYIYPEDAIYQETDFDFRVAVSRGTAKHGSLRKFPGYKRQVMLLDGEVTLSHKGRHDITLGRYEQDVSLGDWETARFGCGTDMSLLTGADFSGRMELLFDRETAARNNGEFAALYCLEDGVRLHFKNQGRVYKEELLRGDCVIVSWFEDGAEAYKLEVFREDGGGEIPLVLLISCSKNPDA